MAGGPYDQTVQASYLGPRLTASLDGIAAPRVLVLARTREAGSVVAQQAPPRAVVDVVMFTGDVDELAVELAKLPCPDLIVDICGGAKGPGRIKRSTTRLTVGGELLFWLGDAPGSPDRRAVEEMLSEVRSAQQAPHFRPPDKRRDLRPRALRDLHALAASVDRVSVDDAWVRLHATRGLLARVPELQMNDVLRQRPDVGRIMHVEPADTWTRQSRFASSQPGEEGPDTVTAPELSLREYRDVVCEPRMAAHVARILLPESLRNPLRRRGGSQVVIDWMSGAAVTTETEPANPLPGVWFYLDNPMRGHFGHALTEQLGHLWAWRRALAEWPELKLLMLGGEVVRDWEYRLLEAAGIGRDRVLATAGPVRVERLVTASAGYVIGEYIHSAQKDLYLQVGAHLAADSELSRTPARIFVTRASDKRRCTNQDEVEQLFVAHGFEIIDPETMPLADQVTYFRNAEIVAGFGGSGMFHALTAPHIRAMIVISSASYHMANEIIIAAYWGVPISIFRGGSKTTTERFSVAMFHSDYTIDWDREGAQLRSEVAEL